MLSSRMSVSSQNASGILWSKTAFEMMRVFSAMPLSLAARRKSTTWGWRVGYLQAQEIARAAHVFTTHTPVPAGFDMFSRDLIAKYFSEPLQQVGLSVDAFMGIGRM